MKACNASRLRACSVALLAAVVLLLTLPSPGQAQSASASAGPDSSQYGGVSADNGTVDIPPAFAGNATDGAERVNEAMSDKGVSSSADPDSADPASAGSAAGGLTVLPETGGAWLPGPFAGVCLLGCGLLLARLSF